MPLIGTLSMAVIVSSLASWRLKKLSEKKQQLKLQRMAEKAESKKNQETNGLTSINDHPFYEKHSSSSDHSSSASSPKIRTRKSKYACLRLLTKSFSI